MPPQQYIRTYGYLTRYLQAVSTCFVLCKVQRGVGTVSTFILLDKALVRKVPFTLAQSAYFANQRSVSMLFIICMTEGAFVLYRASTNSWTMPDSWRRDWRLSLRTSFPTWRKRKRYDFLVTRTWWRPFHSAHVQLYPCFVFPFVKWVVYYYGYQMRMQFKITDLPLALVSNIGDFGVRQ